MSVLIIVSCGNNSKAINKAVIFVICFHFYLFSLAVDGSCITRREGRKIFKDFIFILLFYLLDFGAKWG